MSRLGTSPGHVGVCMSTKFKSVVLVAREAARARLKAGLLDQGRTNPTEQDFLEVIALHLHEGRLRAVSASDGAPINPRTASKAAAYESWMLSPDERRKALGLLRQHVWTEEEADSPLEFTTPACPLVVPPELRALPTEQKIRVQASTGGRGSLSTSTAGSYIAELEATMRRQADGFITLGEAAQALGDAAHDLQDAERCAAIDDWAKDLSSAARTEEIPMHKPGTLRGVDYKSDPTTYRTRRHVSLYREWAHVDDLNLWLDRQNKRVTFRFATCAQAVKEDAQERPLKDAKNVPVAEHLHSRNSVNAAAVVGAPRARWILALGQLLPALENQIDRRATVREVVRYLRDNGSNLSVLPEGNPEELFWRTEQGGKKRVLKKTLHNEISKYRKRKGLPD